MADKQADGVMTIDELAAYLKLSKSSLYQFARAGKVPGVKIGEQWRFQKSAIGEWMRTGAAPKRTGKKRVSSSFTGCHHDGAASTNRHQSSCCR